MGSSDQPRCRSSNRPLGLTSATGLVVASMIGAGVYTTSGFALAQLGTPGRVLAAWFVGGLVALCGAVSYGALAQRFRESGGEYLYLARTIHPAAGFMAGCVSLLAGFTGATAFAATTLESYLGVPGGLVLPGGLSISGSELESILPTDTIAMGAVLLSALMHIYRVRPGVWSQNGLVFLKFGFLLLLLAFALWKFPSGWAGLSAQPSDAALPLSLVAFAMSLMWISLSYSGFNAAIYVAEEIEDAPRVIPRALVLGTLLVSLLYLALNAIFLWGPSPEKISGQAEVATLAAEALGGSPLAGFTRIVIVLSLFTSISAMTILGPRVYAKMAEDGLFPNWFQGHGSVPRAAIVLQACLTLLVIRFTGLQELLSYLGFTLSVSAALTAGTIFVVRRREGAAALPVPAYPLPPLVYVGCTLLFASFAAVRNPWECVAGLGTILVGLLVYGVIKKS